MNWYYCQKCSGIILRDSKAKKIKSVCDETGRDCFIERIDNADELAIRLRKKFLKNEVELRSFKQEERLFLFGAFEQGAAVVFNRLKLGGVIQSIKEQLFIGEYDGFK